MLPTGGRCHRIRRQRAQTRNVALIPASQKQRRRRNAAPSRGTRDGPTAGTQTLDPLAILARLPTHIPDPGHVTTRHEGTAFGLDSRIAAG